MPTAIPAADVADLLHAVNRRIRIATYRDLGALDITPAQARALRVLGRAGTPVRMSVLAERLRIARRSATSVIDALVERDLVHRREDPGDRRAVTVEPTAAGLAVLAELKDRRRAAAAGLLRRLPKRDLATLGDLLRRLDHD